MKLRLLLSIVLVSLFIPAIAQFSNNAALSDSNSRSYAIVQSNDKGHILAGNTANYGAGNEDAYLVKFDTNGSLAWAKTVGGPGFDRFVTMVKSSDGGVVAAGYTNSFGAGLFDVYVVKFDTNGNVKWTRTIGDTTDNFGYSILATIDKGYLICGSTGSVNGSGSSQCYLLKLDSLGNVSWVKTIANKNYKLVGYSVQPCGSGYLIAGSAGIAQIEIIRIDALGNIVWSREVFNLASSIGFPYALMVRLKNGEYAIASTGYYATASLELALFVIDSICNIHAQQSYPFFIDYEIGVNGITATQNGDFMITGSVDDPQDYHSAGDMYFSEYDTNINLIGGSFVGGKVFNFEPVYSASGNCVVQDKDSGFSFGYSAAHSFMYLKVDKKYNSCITGGGGIGRAGYVKDSVAVSHDSVIASNFTASNGGVIGRGGRGLVLPCPGTDTVTSGIPAAQFHVSPNPGSGVFNFWSTPGSIDNGTPLIIDIYNLLGQNIISQVVVYNFQFTLKLEQAAGVYMYLIHTEGGSLIGKGKLVLVK